jgi:hypothetical protein
MQYSTQLYSVLPMLKGSFAFVVGKFTHELFLFMKANKFNLTWLCHESYNFEVLWLASYIKAGNADYTLRL